MIVWIIFGFLSYDFFFSFFLALAYQPLLYCRTCPIEHNYTAYSDTHLYQKSSFHDEYHKIKKQKRASVGTSIDQRPEEINNRETIGHWEMDSVVGPQGKSKKTFLVLTERKSLKEIVEPLKDHTSNEVVRALDRLEREMGEKKFRETFKSITAEKCLY